jgi:hypothetical protein
MSENPEEQQRQMRKGGARYRQQQRKQRKIEQQRSSTGVRRATPERQVKTGTTFTLPDVSPLKPVLRPLGYLALAVVLVFGMIYALRLVNPPEEITFPNAIWLGTNWSYDRPTDEQVAELAAQLRKHRIGTAYVWVSYLQEDQTWSGKRADRDPLTNTITNTVNPATGETYRNELSEMEPNIIAFVEQFKAAYPDGKLYGWISYPTNLDTDGYNLDNTTQHTRIGELAAVLVTDYGFDGIYLNIEPVLDGDENLLVLLRTVRRSLDDAALISGSNIRYPIALAVPPDWRPSDPSIPYSDGFTDVFEWSRAYKQSVALLVDEVLVMAYHSGLARDDEYSVWVAYQTRVYAEAVAELDIDTRVWIGVPTYPAELPAHDPRAENIETTVRGVRSGLIQAGEAAEVVAGLTIYAEWTTDATEWTQFELSWVKAGATSEVAP